MSALAAFLSFLLPLLLLSSPASAAPWIVTSYFEQDLETVLPARTYSAATYRGGTYSYTTYDGTTYAASTRGASVVTGLVNVVPTATSIATLSVETTAYSGYGGVTMVNVLIPVSAGKTVSYDYYATTTAASTPYYVNFFYTASPTCSPRWVYSTAVRMNVPAMVTPTPTSMSTIYSQLRPFGPTSTYYLGFLNPTDFPASYLAEYSSEYAPYFTYYCTVPSAYQSGVVTGAAVPTATGTEAQATGSLITCDPLYSYSDYYWDLGTTYVCSDGSSYTTGISLAGFICAIIFGWLGLFLIIGLVESYIAFSLLVRGRAARRGLPIAFSCLLPMPSCLLLCFHKRGFCAKSPSEQAQLAAEWKATPLLTRFGRWLKWGFRYKYPTFLGAEPPRRRRWQDKSKKEIEVTQPVAQVPMAAGGLASIPEVVVEGPVEGAAVGPAAEAGTAARAVEGSPVSPVSAVSPVSPVSPVEVQHAAPETQTQPELPERPVSAGPGTETRPGGASAPTA